MTNTQKVTAFPTSVRERRRLLRRTRDMRLRIIAVLRALTGWTLMVAVIAFLLMNYRIFSADSFQRIVEYAKMGVNAEPGALDSIEFASGTALEARLFDDGLVLSDSDTIYVAKPGGLNQLTLQLPYASIALEAAGGYIVAYDRGGHGLTLTNALEPLMQTEMSSSILTATVNESGLIAVVTDEAGYKSAVTVLTEDGQQAYKWSSSEYYVQSAALSPSGKRMAALAYRLEGLEVQSRVLFFDLDSPKITAEGALGPTLGLSVRFLSDSMVCAVCDTGTFLVSRTGKVEQGLSYVASDLIGFSFDHNAAAIATRSYTRSARSEITLLFENGKQSEPLCITEELQSLAFSGGRLGLLTSAGLHLYDSTLSPLWSDASAIGGRRLLLSADGTAFVLMSKRAHVITQNRTEGSANAIDINTGDP